MKVAALGDLHFQILDKGKFLNLFKEISENAEVLLLCGDLTAHGQVEEVEALIEDLTMLTIPKMAVLGNHDFEENKQEEIKKILLVAGIIVLDGSNFTVGEIGFAGVKGFGGGFDNRILPAIGEEVSKRYALEAINESLKLENALISLPTLKKVAVLHYSPVHETLKGEDPEIIPFLGSSHLEDPLDHLKITAAFHGHSHHGKLEGKTVKGVPVYNVSLPLLLKHSPKKPYLIIEI